jgi:23S rRNA pseudoU1915 N3-methylase RlmH
VEEISSQVSREADEAARIIDEYKRRLTQFIEGEGERIRREAEQESAAFIARAQEEAEQITKEVRSKAEQEAAMYMAESRQKADQISA